MPKWLLLACTACVVASPAYAQESAENSSDAAAAQPQPADTANAIVVTARRRSEQLQDVPLSITAVSGDTLQERGVSDALSLQYQTPSLSVTPNGASRASVSYAIRGQRSQEAQLLTDSPVGTYFAEVVMPRTYGFGTAFYDIQNVQVLKGVQGTLFGRNMTGGAVLVEPNAPSFKGIEAEGSAQVGNYDMTDFYAMLNVPVTDFLAIRAAGKIYDRDGFTTDVSNGRDYDDQHYKAFRVAATIEKGDFKSVTYFDWMKENDHGTALKLNAFSTVDPVNGSTTVMGQQIAASPNFPIAAGAPPEDLAGLAQYALGLGKYKVDYGGVGTGVLDGTSGLPYTKVKNWGITNKTTLDVGDITFKNVFGYRKISYENHSDYDGGPFHLILPIQISDTKDISEEFQIQGKPFGSRFDFTLGAFYLRESGTDGALTGNFPQLSSIGYASSMPSLAGYFLSQPASFYMQDARAQGVADSWAMYAAGNYKLTDTVTLSGGIRYNRDSRKATVSPNMPNFAFPGGTPGVCLYNGFGKFSLDDCAQTRKLKNEAVTWDATIQYEPTNAVTAYIAARQGYRAGGFNLRADSDALFVPFQPEKVREYEVGLKNHFYIGSADLRTSAAIFYQNYTNVQRQNPILLTSGNVGTIVTNVGKQHNYGGEFEANLTLPGGWNFNAFYSYVAADVVSGDNGANPLQGSPHHQAGGSVTYSNDLPFAHLLTNVNVAYKSQVPLDDFDPLYQKGYALVNGRIAFEEIAGTGLGVALFGKNLFDKFYYMPGISLLSGGPAQGIVTPNGVGLSAVVQGEPRTYGIEVSYKF